MKSMVVHLAVKDLHTCCCCCCCYCCFFSLSSFYVGKHSLIRFNYFESLSFSSLTVSARVCVCVCVCYSSSSPSFSQPLLYILLPLSSVCSCLLFVLIWRRYRYVPNFIYIKRQVSFFSSSFLNDVRIRRVGHARRTCRETIEVCHFLTKVYQRN